MEKASSVALWVNPDTSLTGLFGNTWQLVFEVEAFSGIDILPYLRHGTISARAPETSVDSHKIFRHPDLTTKLETASLIKVLYYDLGMQNVVQELRFSGNGDPETWFSVDQFQSASSWNINPQGSHNGKIVLAKFSCKFCFTGFSKNQRQFNHFWLFISWVWKKMRMASCHKNLHIVCLICKNSNVSKLRSETLKFRQNG